MRVVIIGTGRLGCGYIAPLFAEAGWQVVMAARTADIARRINENGGFRIVEVEDDGERVEQDIRGLRATAVGGREFNDAVLAADLVVVSVGVGNVTALAEPLATALHGRRSPLDIWLVENGDVSRMVESAVEAWADEHGISLPPLGVAGAVATVAVARGGWHPGTVPEFVGDAARTLRVDGTRLVTSVPHLPGVAVTANYDLCLREKLYVFNAGHAIAGYLGWLQRHRTVDDAVTDPFLRPIIAGCMLESRRALVAAYPEIDGVEEPVSEALRRFANPVLADPVTRVARDPIRKLRPGDRLLGPVSLIRRTTGAVPAYFALSIAGALLYRGAGDTEADQLDDLLREEGVNAVLGSICGLPPDDPVTAAVVNRYRGFVFGEVETLFPAVHAGELVS